MDEASERLLAISEQFTPEEREALSRAMLTEDREWSAAEAVAFSKWERLGGPAAAKAYRERPDYDPNPPPRAPDILDLFDKTELEQLCLAIVALRNNAAM